MTNPSTLQRLRNALYTIWGLLHVAIGASTGAIQASGGSRDALEQMASILPPETLPDEIPTVVDGLVAQHSWDLTAVGLLTLVIVVVGRKQAIPWWILAAITGATEIGLVVSLSVTGFETLFPILVGPIIWVLAVLCDLATRFADR